MSLHLLTLTAHAAWLVSLLVMNTSTGYGPSSRYSRLYFNGDASKYEIWEEKFKGYLKTQKLKEAVCSTAQPLSEALAAKNEEAYAELILLIDDNSLALIRKDAKDDCRKALKLLHEHYAGKGKPRVISLYTDLTSLRKSPDTPVSSLYISLV